MNQLHTKKRKLFGHQSPCLSLVSQRAKTEMLVNPCPPATGAAQGFRLDERLLVLLPVEVFQYSPCYKHFSWESQIPGCNSAKQEYGCGSILSHQGTAYFSPCVHLPGFHFGDLILTHSHIFMLHRVLFAHLHSLGKSAAGALLPALIGQEMASPDSRLCAKVVTLPQTIPWKLPGLWKTWSHVSLGECT